MAMQQRDVFTLAAGGTIYPFRLVKLSGITAVHNTATATDVPVGVAQPPYGAATYTSTRPDNVAIRDIKSGGTQQVTAAGVISAGAAIYAANDGKVQAVGGSATYRLMGYAIDAAGADGDIIQAYIMDNGVQVST